MFVVSFRIPYHTPLGKVYINGAAASLSRQYQKGELIHVKSKNPRMGTTLFAQVIDTRYTQGPEDKFPWIIKDM